MSTGTTSESAAAPSAGAGFWNRQLQHYPSGRTRVTCLGIVVLATIVLYYQFYLAGAVATHIIAEYHMSFVYYVNISVVGYILGAAASFATGAADRYGRVNIVTIGLFIVGLLCLLGIPNTHSKLGFGIVFVLIGVVEGIILVATPALIRDFSPQLGRASAMGFWTLGPVLGSLVVSIQVSNTSDSTAWQDHYIAAGVVGLVVAALSAAFLRELAPNLRDQIMVSARDRALVEARAKGIDVEASLRSPFRQMLKPDIVLSAFAISVFLIIYYLAVGFFPVYFQTIFGFSQQDANGLGNWNWAFNAIALLLIGFASDKVMVRKPFMIVGAVGAIVMTIIFLSRATHPDTSYYTFVVIVSLLAVFLGVAYAPWMASFTETVERRNPALTATGLAVWGLIIRIVIAVSVFFVPHVVDTVTTLVDKGGAVQQALDDPKLTADQRSVVQAVAADPSIVTKAQSLAAKYKTELATAAKIDPATQAALAKNPNDVNAQIKALSELTGVSVADVTTVVQLNLQHAQALQAGAAIDTATATTLLTDPTNKQAGAKAVQEIVAKLHVTQQQAVALITELRSIPPQQLLVVKQDGPKVVVAAAQLKKLGAIPAADLAFLKKYGPALQDPNVQADLKFLQANGPAVQQAAADSPKQWQHYFWVAVGGEIVFIPLIFLMAGYWSTRRARQAEQEHEAWVADELAKLGDY
ncbi:MAG TPA: MFS transporter [Jatrophihabitans sp.]|jgi:MFS family permease